MYLYQVDKAVTYTSEDLVLFRDSPFACWMERLTLENPDHGIPPDPDSPPPENSMMRQDDVADTLRAEGKDVLLVDWKAEEPIRRCATLEAMRQGTDFIINGQLALGPLSGSANLLMRTSGYSELGDYLYIPCDTQAKTTLHSAFRLCFLADLLHSLQGQLPPQMLIVRSGDLVPLKTEDHIYHYRAVKHRFMDAMREFRKHRMPDPSESAQFGRWSECAHEVLKQRSMRKDEDWRDEDEAQEPEKVEEQPLHQIAAGGDISDPAIQDYNPETTRRTLAPGAAPGAAVRSPGGQVPTGPTLAEQARMLAPAGAGEVRADATAEAYRPVAHPEVAYGQSTPPGPTLDSALENLEFIGRSSSGPHVGQAAPRRDVPRRKSPEPATPEEFPEEVEATEVEATEDVVVEDRAFAGVFDPDLPDPYEPLPLPEVEEISLDGSVMPDAWSQPEQPATVETDEIYIEGAPPPALKPARAWERRPEDSLPTAEPGSRRPELQPAPGADSDEPDRPAPFSSSLITSESCED
jgi:hypothetical protein